ncbi:MAG: hypothetical protein CMB99_01335 [Flavobacteriaceae bacterium]|nr:hypothetical protein [Flavobacteriaceae bacterium]|tara:strand:+ start:338 stop:688 length:351 start_codon:yes stop_codon:yes gene_type:complete
MNRRLPPTRYTQTVGAVDASWNALTFDNTGLPANGWFHQVMITKNSGTGTQVKFRLREAAAGRVIYLLDTLENFTLEHADGKLGYFIGGGDNLTAEVWVDAGADTNLTVELLLEEA